MNRQPTLSPDRFHLVLAVIVLSWGAACATVGGGAPSGSDEQPDGKDETKIVDNASWGTWISDDEIVFARGTAILRRKLAGGEETLLVDSTKVPELDGALMQQPEMSKDGDFIAITLRGSKRETGL